ncbi:MAG: diguanylate cyclase [Telmatospirillum sp.]|nr:diguanylate cyclase [Telmatospirillum sp.]
MQTVVPSDETLHVLIIEDNPGDARLATLQLTEDPDQVFECSVAMSLAQANVLKAGQSFDLVIADLGLPDSAGAATVDSLVTSWPDTPIVVLTGLADRKIGTYAVQRGCQDYLVKGFSDPAVLQRTARHAIERGRAARDLKESEQKLRTLIDVSPDAILLCDGKEILFANARAMAILGAAGWHDLIGIDPSRLFVPTDWRRLIHSQTRASSEPGDFEPFRLEGRLIRRDGSLFDAEVTVAAVRHQHRPAFEMIVRDITERIVSERHRHLASIFFETTDEAVIVTDETNTIVAVNPAFERVTGYRGGEVLGLNPRILASGRHGRDFYQAMWSTLLRTGHWHGDVWNRRKNGEIYVQRLTLSLIRDSEGRVVNHIGVSSDITDEQQEAERIRYRANYDALTGLPNRALLLDRMSQALAKAVREDSGLGILFLDLDGFKPVNDHFGHLAGDHLLMDLSERLQRCVRESDTVARLGGDEFVVLVPDIICPADAEGVAVKVLGCFDDPFVLDKGQAVARIGGSIGIALYPLHGDNPEALLDAADRAMYAAKEAGKRCYRIAGERP